MSSNLEGRATHDMNKVGQGVALYLGHRQLKEGRTPDSFLGRYPPPQVYITKSLPHLLLCAWEERMDQHMPINLVDLSGVTTASTQQVTALTSVTG